MEPTSIDPRLDSFSGTKNLMPYLPESLTIRDARDGKPLAADPFRDPRVRQAASLAIDRAGCVRADLRRPGVW